MASEPDCPSASDPLLPRRAPPTGGWKSALFIICKLLITRVPGQARLAWQGLIGACLRWQSNPRGGGGGAVRVLRHLVEPDQLPHRPARADHGGGGRVRQRVVGRRVDAAAARRRRRRLLARPLPHHRRLLRALHHGQHPQPTLTDILLITTSHYFSSGISSSSLLQVFPAIAVFSFSGILYTTLLAPLATLRASLVAGMWLYARLQSRNAVSA